MFSFMFQAVTWRQLIICQFVFWAHPHRSRQEELAHGADIWKNASSFQQQLFLELEQNINHKNLKIKLLQQVSSTQRWTWTTAEWKSHPEEEHSKTVHRYVINPLQDDND